MLSVTERPRHGFFSCYEALIHIIDSMFKPARQGLKVCQHISLAAPDRIASIPGRGHVGGRTTMGFSHQEPRLHRPRRQTRSKCGPVLYCRRDVQHAPVGDRHCSQPRNDVNVIIAGRQPAPRQHMADDGPGRQALHGRHSASGRGQQRQGCERTCHGLSRGCCSPGEHWPPSYMLPPASAGAEVRVWSTILNLIETANRPRETSARPLSDRDFDALSEGQTDTSSP